MWVYLLILRSGLWIMSVSCLHYFFCKPLQQQSVEFHSCRLETSPQPFPPLLSFHRPNIVWAVLLIFNVERQLFELKCGKMTQTMPFAVHWYFPHAAWCKHTDFQIIDPLKILWVLYPVVLWRLQENSTFLTSWLGLCVLTVCWTQQRHCCWFNSLLAWCVNTTG